MARHIKQGTVRDNSTGAVIAGATVTVSLTGGTSIATIYDAYSGGSTISNGVISTDSNGYYQFFIDDDDYAQTQNFRITMSASSFTTRTYDNIQIYPFLDQLVIDVRDFGSKGDGSVDDSTAIQDAINTAEAAGGGRVVFPKGIHIISAELIIDDDNVILMGQGYGLSEIKRDTTADIARLVRFYKNSSTQLLGNGIIGLKINSVNSIGQTGDNGGGVMFGNCAFFVARDLYITDTRSTGFTLWHGGSGGATEHGMIDNVMVIGVGDPDDSDSNDPTTAPDSFGMVGASYNKFNNLYVYNGGAGGNGFTLFDGCKENVISNLIIGDVENSGLAFDGVNGTRAFLTGNHYNNIQIKNTGAAGVWLLANTLEKADLRDNIFTNISIDNSSTHGVRIDASNSSFDAQRIQFYGLNVRNCGGWAISNNNGYECVFEGVEDNNTSGSYTESGPDAFRNRVALNSRPATFGTGAATFADQDTTPEIGSSSLFHASNTIATTITMFDGGVVGREVKVIFTNNNTTIDFTGTNLKGNGGANWNPTTFDHMTCVFDGTYWYCDISDNSA